MSYFNSIFERIPLSKCNHHKFNIIYDLAKKKNDFNSNTIDKKSINVLERNNF